MAVREKDAIGRVCLSLTACKGAKRLSLCACVSVCARVCVCGLLMLTGNHVSGSVIPDCELEAGEAQRGVRQTSALHNHNTNIINIP